MVVESIAFASKLACMWVPIQLNPPAFSTYLTLHKLLFTISPSLNFLTISSAASKLFFVFSK